MKIAYSHSIGTTFSFRFIKAQQLILRQDADMEQIRKPSLKKKIYAPSVNVIFLLNY